MSYTSQIIFIGILSCISYAAIGQNENNQWFFGLQAALDYSTNPPIYINGSEMIAREGCASISDATGQLLFYTNGLTVWNKFHQAMPNGTGLAGGMETSSTHQALICPIPSQEGQYYIFTTDERARSNGLSYSIIDMNLSNGLGDLTTKNTLLFAPSSERITLARHSNGTDFWLIAQAWESNEFKIYLINKTGIQTPAMTHVLGSMNTISTNNIHNARGCMQFNSTGTLLAIAKQIDHLVEVFEFNPCNGDLSLKTTLSSIEAPYGVAFSPNNDFLYITNDSGTLYQYQINNQNIQVIGQAQDDRLGAIQIAPDKKLYVAIPNANQIGVIHQPDLLGQAANYQDLAIDLDIGLCAEGLPQTLPPITNYQPKGFSDAAIFLNGSCINETILFEITSSETINKVSWQIDGQLLSQNLTIEKILNDTTPHQIIAIISNECKQDTLLDTFQLQNCDPPFFVPNVFSPNFDGHNDTFEPLGNLDLLDTYEMTIFSRWGECIFTTKDKQEGWNGTFNGKILPIGVYVWMIKTKYLGLVKEKVFSGDVTLLK